MSERKLHSDGGFGTIQSMKSISLSLSLSLSHHTTPSYSLASFTNNGIIFTAVVENCAISPMTCCFHHQPLPPPIHFPRYYCLWLFSGICCPLFALSLLNAINHIYPLIQTHNLSIYFLLSLLFTLILTYLHVNHFKAIISFHLNQ